jgi:hypothetical protein
MHDLYACNLFYPALYKYFVWHCVDDVIVLSSYCVPSMDCVSVTKPRHSPVVLGPA